MPKLENFDNYIKVDGNPFAKNAINYQVSDGFVSLYYISQDRILQKTRAVFSDWTDGGLEPYTDILSLTEDFDKFLFDNKSIEQSIFEQNIKMLCVLTEILKELEKANLHNSIITDENL